MTRLGRYLLVGIVLVAGVLALAGPALANHTGISQFLALKSHDSGIKIWNPSSPEMFVLVINYDGDEIFQNCTGLLLSRHDVAKATGFDNGYTEIIAVPTSNPRRDPSHLIGVDAARHKGRIFTKIDDRIFKLPQSDNEGLHNLLSCACQELDNLGLPLTLLKVFGFSFGAHCPEKI